MPKKESSVERHEKFNKTYTENPPYLDQALADYAKKSRELPRLTRKEIESGIKEASYDRYRGQESPSGKLSYLNRILKPVDSVINGSIFQNPGEKIIYLRDAFDLYQELAKTYESHRDWQNAARSLYKAGLIARKAKAKTTANKLFSKAGELMDNMPLSGNKSPDREFYLKSGEAYEKMGQMGEKETKDWREKGSRYPPNNSSVSESYEGYEMAGDHESLARVARENNGLGAPGNLRGLKKAGKYGELAKTYEEHANELEEKEYPMWVQRYRRNAEKIRKFIATKALDKSLEQKVAAVISIFTLLSALLFISSGITGNVIGNFTLDKTMGVGSILFITGIITSIIYFRSKR